MVCLSQKARFGSDMVELLVWQRLFSLFTSEEKQNLSSFGERYGQQALEQKFIGMLQIRCEQQNVSISDVYSEVMSRVASLEKINPTKEKNIANKAVTTKKTSQTQKKKNDPEMVGAFAPISNGLFIFKFWTDVVEQNFTSQEQKYWQQRLIDQKDDMAFIDFGRAIEKRLDRPFEKVIDVTRFDTSLVMNRVVNDSITELKAISKTGKNEELFTALQKGDVVTAADIYKEASEVDIE